MDKEVFTSSKEPAAVSMEVIQRGKEFLKTVPPRGLPENPYADAERETKVRS